MAMKEKIALGRDRMIDEIKSSDMGDLEKEELTNILVDAADGTNGLSKEDKLQNVSETVFALAKLDTRGAIDRFESAKRDVAIQESIAVISQKVDSVVDKLSTVSEKLIKNDEITNNLKSEFEEVKKTKKSKLEIFLNGLKNLDWYWAVAATIITGLIVYKPNILEFLKEML